MLKRKYYILPAFLLLAFSFTGNPPGGWYLQVMPDLGGRQISDIFFLDSLNGWAVTPYTTQNDTAFVIRTSDGGDNWSISNVRPGQFVGYNKIKFLNTSTGFVCGVSQMSGFKGLSKSVDGGSSWVSLNVPDPFLTYNDMSVLSQDTIWLAASESLTGGLYRTTNGGLNWTQQYYQFGSNPSKIYMYDRNIGFIEANGLRKTTDGGMSFSLVSGESTFLDMHFVDSQTGWLCNGNMRKTTNGGLNWTTQVLQTGGYIQVSGILNFSHVGRDTIWGTGGYVLYPNNQVRSIIHRTTNGGANWYYQIPDTSIQIFPEYIQFTDSRHGWAYATTPRGIHTFTGGDTTFTSISSTSTEIPSSFILYQNYPNPFNPKTTIKYTNIKKQNVKLIIYSSEGKEIAVLINQVQPAGTYSYEFNATGYTSGIYFYRLTAEDRTETKKAILIK